MSWSGFRGYTGMRNTEGSIVQNLGSDERGEVAIFRRIVRVVVGLKTFVGAKAIA